MKAHMAGLERGNFMQHDPAESALSQLHLMGLGHRESSFHTYMNRHDHPDRSDPK